MRLVLRPEDHWQRSPEQNERRQAQVVGQGRPWYSLAEGVLFNHRDVMTTCAGTTYIADAVAGGLPSPRTPKNHGESQNDLVSTTFGSLWASAVARGRFAQ